MCGDELCCLAAAREDKRTMMTSCSSDNTTGNDTSYADVT